MTAVETRAVGQALGRVEGVAKVTGQARYSGEIPLDRLAYGWVVQSSIARGTIRTLDVAAVLAMPGVVGVLTHQNAPRLSAIDDGELARLLQSDEVRHYGEVVAVVVAGTLEQAWAGAESLPVRYTQASHDVELRADHPAMYTPDHVNPSFPTDTVKGDVDAAIAAAAHTVDATYTTPTQHNNPMEPHVTTAQWQGDHLTAYDSNQGASSVKGTLAKLFGLEADQVRVVSEHVGGGFGSKGSARPPVVLAAMAARAFDRPVRVTLTRQQMFTLVGYRTPTIQRVRLAAEADGTLTALDHLVYEQTSTVMEFAEQTAVMSRVMYRTPNLRTRHRLVALDVPTPRWMRAPGETPGSFALEAAIDELAVECGMDPVQLRIANDADVEPESGRQFSSRNLVACLHVGAGRFGWHDRDPRPGIRRDGRWLIGTGVGCSTYPARSSPSTATVEAGADGTFDVRIAAADIGTGARTALTQVAADALDVSVARVRVHLGDSDFGPAMIAGGSMGTASWSWAIVKACDDLRRQMDAHGGVPAGGMSARANTSADVKAQADLVRHSFGAQFVEARVDVDTGEIRVPRMLGIFAAGRIVNPVTARSQFIGGMTWGLSMALHEESVMDAHFGDYVTHDLASYHFAANADVGTIEVDWIDERDDMVNPNGIKGIGEVGIVGTAAAVANAVWHATGVRYRDLPLRLDRVLAG
jgi:xanthine dehydrogenase YagR molybdenum-binding subunit